MNENPLKPTVNHIGHELIVRFHYQPIERVDISLETEDGEPWCDATKNAPGLDHDEIAIKDYSENAGILQALYDAGYIEKPHRQEQSGFTQLEITRMTPAAKEMAEKQFEADLKLFDEGTPAAAPARPKPRR